MSCCLWTAGFANQSRWYGILSLFFLPTAFCEFVQQDYCMVRGTVEHHFNPGAIRMQQMPYTVPAVQVLKWKYNLSHDNHIPRNISTKVGPRMNKHPLWRFNHSVHTKHDSIKYISEAPWMLPEISCSCKGRSDLLLLVCGPNTFRVKQEVNYMIDIITDYPSRVW